MCVFMTPSVLFTDGMKEWSGPFATATSLLRLLVLFTDGIKSEVAVEKGDAVSAQRERRFSCPPKCKRLSLTTSDSQPEVPHNRRICIEVTRARQKNSNVIKRSTMFGLMATKNFFSQISMNSNEKYVSDFLG